jgi:signal transduction histidine kinase
MERDLFAGGVAHDLRNLLGVIMLQCGPAERAPTPDACADALGRVAHQSRRVGSTLDALLEFARAGARPERGRKSDAAAVVDEVVADALPHAAEAETPSWSTRRVG